MKVIHVCATSTAKGSRVEAQRQVVDSDVVALSSMLPSGRLICHLIKNKKSTYIFHEQYTLINLFFIYLLSILFRKKNEFIYDIHDVLRKKPTVSFKAKLAFYPLMIIECWAIARIKILTVSRGLAEYYRIRSEKNIGVFYNLIPTDGALDGQKFPVYMSSRRAGNKAIYFGQIYESRITISDIKSLSEQGLSVSLSGRFPASASTEYQRNIIAEIEKSGGQFLGEYSPSNLNFLKDFDYSIMLFGEKSENIVHCMPNKLFQSLSYGLTCLVSPHLIEIISEFYDTGFVITSEDDLTESKVKLFDTLSEKLARMNKNNHLVFKKLINSRDASLK
ncbi:MAG: hypothetical protein WEA82_05230 [Idiomarina sp.]